MEKYSIVAELEDKNANLLQIQSNQILEIADLKALNMDLKEKEKHLKEENAVLTEKMLN